MEQAKIDRINFLANKKKTVGLTEGELKEQEDAGISVIEA